MLMFGRQKPPGLCTINLNPAVMIKHEIPAHRWSTWNIVVIIVESIPSKLNTVLTPRL